MKRIEIINKNEKALPSISGDRLIFWFLWPFGALLYALKHFRQPSSKTICWLFCLYFGFVFIYADPFAEGGADSARYAQYLIELHNHPLSFDTFKSLFYTDEGYVDIYQPLMMWLVSLFTDNARWLFVLFAAVFGFFYVQNLWIIFNSLKNKGKISTLIFFFLLTFALINPIWNINGVRMWTAAQVYIYGILLYFLKDDKKGMIWIVSSILIHFSFIFPVLCFIVYLVIPKNLTVFTILFFGAALINEINVSQISNILYYLPDFLLPRVESYTNETYIDIITSSQQALASHVKIANTFGRWLLYAWVLILYFNRKYWQDKYENINKLMGFGLFLGIFALLASHMPSGGRFMTLVNVILFGVFTLLLSAPVASNKSKIFQHISIPFLAFYCIFLIRVGFDYIGLSTFMGNPLTALFVRDETPLIVLVKQIF
jgi:hypothetical protein